MRKEFVLTQKDFDNLLGWLSADREEAGKKYEEIRECLVRFFRFKGCSDPAILADETINRVAVKVSSFDSDKEVKTITYFYGFAKKIYLEYISQTRKMEVQLETNCPLKDTHTIDFGANEGQDFNCLEDCLAKLPPVESKIVVMYYSRDKRAKLEQRKKMAESMNLKMGALHIKIHRIKNVLKECVKECMNKKNL
jgi:DNA-directed RNA polymerase specialized sigma24 family protein